MVRVDEALLKIVGNIYDAALEPSRWHRALDEARDFIGGAAAAIYSRDILGQPFAVHHDDGGIDPYYTQLYTREHTGLDPTWRAQCQATVDKPLSTADMIDYREFVTTPAYLQWGKPQGLVDFICIGVGRSARTIKLFGVFRHERNGMIDDRARRRMRAIGPHIQRAALIEASLTMRSAECTALTDLLDELGSALLLARPGGHIVHANATALDLLAAARVAHAPGGRLTLRDRAANRALAAALAACEGGDETIGRRGVSIPLAAGDGQRHVAHVIPLTSGARRQAGHLYGAAAAVFLREVAIDLSWSAETVARHYRLTPSELRVLLAVLESGATADVAETLGVSVPTVKTHLGNIYVKTGAGRQADLVKLVAAFANPLVS
jgi:DNA-binding CsgD family transcriptional regulator